MPASFRLRTLALALPLLLAACATTTQPEPPRSTRGATDDLGLIADLALSLAERHGANDVLVVLDIDNTILAMEQGLGSDQWYYWQAALRDDEPCSPETVNDLLAVQGALFYASAMRPTQPSAVAQVRRMQDEGLQVIILTSRGPQYRLATFRELRRNGFSLWSSALPPQHGHAEDGAEQGGQDHVHRGMRAAERQLAAQSARIGVATADLYPTFFLLGDFGYLGVRGDFFDSDRETYSFGPSIRWNIFDGGRVRANVRVQDALTEQLLEDEEVRHDAAIQLSVTGSFLREPQALIDQLVAALKNTDPILRAGAAFALGWRGNAAAAIPLIELLYDPDAQVQQAAVNALSNLQDDRIAQLIGDFKGLLR